MSIQSSRFVLKASLVLVGFVISLFLITLSIEATTTRFGNAGWIHWLIGLLSFVSGLIVAWATIVTWIDRRSLRRHRVDEGINLTDGQSVALSGQVRVEGDAIHAPFSGTPCACVSYQVTGQRRADGDSTEDHRQQLCLLGFHLAPAVLDCGSRSFRLLAIPDVDTDFRSTEMGGEWGEQALTRIRAAAEEWTHADEPKARDALEAAQKHTDIPVAVDLFVAPTQTGANKITVLEDAVPIDTPVTVLASYAAQERGLDGRRFGGMKIFAGDIDERLAALDQEWRKGLVIGLPLMAVGLALLTLGSWWPT